MNAQPVAVMLKDSTQQLHSDVENLLLPNLAAIQQRSDYAAMLRMFYGFYAPLETRLQLFVTPAVLPDIAERRKAAAILLDLEALQEETTGLALCHHLPHIENEAQAVGAMYVLEGSTLGGKMIAKMLLNNKTLSLTEDELQFFSGYKEETGSKWKGFLTVLNRQTDVAQTTAAANDTFRYMKNWMQHFYHG